MYAFLLIMSITVDISYPPFVAKSYPLFRSWSPVGRLPRASLWNIVLTFYPDNERYPKKAPMAALSYYHKPLEHVGL